MKYSRSELEKVVELPVKLKVFYRVLGASLVGAALIFCFAPWVQTVRATGRVLAYSPNERSQKISAPVEGRIKTWFVFEGSSVKKGMPIAELVDNDPDILRRLDVEKAASERKLEAAKLGVSTARKNLERQKALFEEGLSSKRTFEQAHLELVRYMTDEANATADLSRVEVRLARQKNQLVVAPLDGVIQTRLSGQEGEIVKSGDFLATLVPDTESRAVELWVDGVDMPLLKVGQEVRLQFEGWPAIQFSGWPTVAVGTFSGRVGLIDAADNGSGRFRVLVVPIEGASWPSTLYLRQGVKAIGWMNINRTLMIFELWRRFNAFPIAPVTPPSKTVSESK